MPLKTIPIDEVFARHIPARRMVSIDQRADAAARKMLLRDLRKSLGVTQKQLSTAMGVSQPVLSQLENRADFQLATLRRVVRALGGELDVIARFPGRTVSIQVPAAGRSR